MDTTNSKNISREAPRFLQASKMAVLLNCDDGEFMTAMTPVMPRASGFLKCLRYPTRSLRLALRPTKCNLLTFLLSIKTLSLVDLVINNLRLPLTLDEDSQNSMVWNSQNNDHIICQKPRNVPQILIGWMDSEILIATWIHKMGLYMYERSSKTDPSKDSKQNWIIQLQSTSSNWPLCPRLSTSTVLQLQQTSCRHRSRVLQRHAPEECENLLENEDDTWKDKEECLQTSIFPGRMSNPTESAFKNQNRILEVRVIVTVDDKIATSTICRLHPESTKEINLEDIINMLKWSTKFFSGTVSQ